MTGQMRAGNWLPRKTARRKYMKISTGVFLTVEISGGFSSFNFSVFCAFCTTNTNYIYIKK